ncbi:hypothetical protein NHF46_05650 [Arthrobacter alpinus]|nr:hypothetical protein [Arthrobacter alpinus]
MNRLIKAALLCVVLPGMVLPSGCSARPSIPSAQEPTGVVNGNSQFTPTGIKAIKASRQASFDVSDLPLAMSALALPKDRMESSSQRIPRRRSMSASQRPMAWSP